MTLVILQRAVLVRPPDAALSAGQRKRLASPPEQRIFTLMAAGALFELKLKCPKCGKTGVAQAFEDDNPLKRHPGFEVDELPNGFKLAKYSNSRHDTKVVCQCGEVFNL